jgi:tRNA G18 (ribose-2'-O)-methylase SpoU
MMASIIDVADPGDPRLADYARLTDVRLRTSMESAHGLFMAEGEKVIRRAVAAGFGVRSMLVTRDKLAGLADLAGTCPGPVYVISQEVAEQVTGYQVHRGALASMARRALPTVTSLLSGSAAARDGAAGGGAGPAPPGSGQQARDGQPGWPRRIVLLEDLVDHANVGAIFRCAAALGVDAVILSPRCADPLYRRAVKVSMGAVFAIPYAGSVGHPAGQGHLGRPRCAAARHRRRRVVLALAGRGRHGGLRSDERGRDGTGSRLAERCRGRRDRLPRTGAPARVTRGYRAACALKYALASFRHR